jgi:hypothetical protein
VAKLPQVLLDTKQPLAEMQEVAVAVMQEVAGLETQTTVVIPPAERVEVEVLIGTQSLLK